MKRKVTMTFEAEDGEIGCEINLTVEPGSLTAGEEADNVALYLAGIAFDAVKEAITR